jgi:hypothetical protein
MQVNAAISLIKSNNFEQARKLISNLQNGEQINLEFHAATLNSLEVYILVKEKKLEEALKVKMGTTLREAFIRAQLYLQLKKPLESLQSLIAFLESASNS